MGLSTFFGFRTISQSGNNELPEIFPLSINSELFVDTDVKNVYSRILTDCIDRTQGIPDDIYPLLWDNFIQNESPYGLISLLACAMTEKDQMFLVYIPSLGVLRTATPQEEDVIKNAYKTGKEATGPFSDGKSGRGIFISFENYRRTDMVKVYSAMEYCVVSSLNKMANLSKAIQFKMSDMRGSTALIDSSVVISQAILIAQALRNGRDVMIDKQDEIFTNAPDISAIKESIAFLDSKKAFYYGLPLSYINGEQTPGIGSTGEADTRAIERGLKNYFISILKPIIEDLFALKISFKSNDFRQINSALEAIKTFDLVSDAFISQQNKKMIIDKLFDLNINTNQS